MVDVLCGTSAYQLCYVSLDIPAGKTTGTALVGTSGSGNDTIISSVREVLLTYRGNDIPGWTRCQHVEFKIGAGADSVSKPRASFV